MTNCISSSLPPIYDDVVDITKVESATIDIEKFSEEFSVEVMAIQKNRGNPLTSVLGRDSGIYFCLPSMIEGEGVLISSDNVSSVIEKESKKECELCGEEYKYGRPVVLFQLERDHSESLFNIMWFGIDCLTHIDTSLEDVSDSLNSKAVKELI